MGEVQKGFDEILTLTAEEADALVIEEEDDGVSQDILERSLVAKLYSPKLVHNKSFKNRMLEIWDPVGEVNIKELSINECKKITSERIVQRMFQRKRNGTLDLILIEFPTNFQRFSLELIFIHKETIRLAKSQRVCRPKQGEARKGEPVMEGEASKHRRVDDGKNTEIVMYESVVGSEMLAHHEQ
ncbi:unnamed protein product [Prunus armeniaca]